MKNGKLCAGIIGLHEGFRYIEAFRDNPEYELCGLCDIDPEVIESRIRRHNVNQEIFRCGDYRDLLSIPEIDVIAVVSPDFFHAEHAIAAMEAGKHVICEKPMTLDLGECKEIIAAVKRTNRHFIIAHPTRYTPAFILARRIIRRGDIGDLFLVESEYAHNYSRAGGKNNWRKDPRRDPLLGGGCHAMDLIRWTTDSPVEEAFAYANHKNLPDWPVAFDTYMASFKFANGVIGKVMCSMGVSRPYTMRSVFYGTQGTIICDNMSPELQLSSDILFGTPDDHHTPFAQIPVEVNNHNVPAEIALMADIILRGAKNIADVTEGALTVASCVAAIKSAHTGNPVKVFHDF